MGFDKDLNIEDCAHSLIREGSIVEAYALVLLMQIRERLDKLIEQGGKP